jgi:hypothetical protein
MSGGSGCSSLGVKDGVSGGNEDGLTAIPRAAHHCYRRAVNLDQVEGTICRLWHKYYSRALPSRSSSVVHMRKMYVYIAEANL